MATSTSTSPNTMDNNTLYLYRLLRRDECQEEWSCADGKEFFDKWSVEELDEKLDKFRGEWTEPNPEQVIKAKDPESTETVEEHVSRGGRQGFKSKFISTAKTLNGARVFASKTVRKPVRIVEINIGSLLSSGENVQVIDLTNAGVVDHHISANNMRARNFAKKFEEVLIVGTIPYTYLGRVLEIQESGSMRWFYRNTLDFNPRFLHRFNRD